MATKKVGAAGRFRAGYGKSVRVRIATIEKKQRTRQKCPFCNHKSVKRLSAGIWHCVKCGKKFASDAYHLE